MLIARRRVCAWLGTCLLGTPRVLSAQVAATDYPQWRGLERDGGASAFRAPDQWPDALTRRWRVEVGEGYSTPLVIRDSVYTFTRVSGREVTRALALDTGAIRWEASYPLPYTPSSPTAAHGAGPKATPVFLADTLVTMGVSGIVSACDARTGQQLWQTAAPVETPVFSAAASPVGIGNLVVAHPGNYDPLTAFDIRSGAVRWRAGDGGFFMAPVVAVLDGEPHIVTVTQSAVIGVDPASGRVLWTHPWTGGRQGGTTPVVYEGTVIVSATRSDIRAIRPVHDGVAWRPVTAWATTEASMYISDPVIIDGVLYGLAEQNSGQLVALDARTGGVLWRGPARDAAHVSFVKASGLLFLLKDDAELIVATPSRTSLNPMTRYVVAGSATYAQPVVSGSSILIKDSTYLTRWTVP